jgi:hypothetical protein
MYSIGDQINLRTLKEYAEYLGLLIEKHGVWITVYRNGTNMYHDNSVYNVYAFLRGYDWATKVK